MGCLFVILALGFPRLVLVVLYLFTSYIANAYSSMLLPVLGFIFLPYTTLAYAWAIQAHGSASSGIYLGLVIAAFIIDIATVTGGAKKHKVIKIR